MTKNIILFLSFILCSVSMTAQVRMFYADHLCGKISQEDLSKISVSNFTPVTIEFIYKATVVNEQGEEVIRLESKIISCNRGFTDYAKEKIKTLQVLKQEIDLASYTGKLTIHSMIVHPQDKTSIIANVEKILILKNGISMTENGKVLTNPQLFRIDPKTRYGEKFELENLYDKIVFQNENFSAHCIDLTFVITQGQNEIYNAIFTELCLPPGESSLTEAQRAEVKIILDEYETRNPNKPIRVQFKYGENSTGSRNIEAVNHYDHGMGYERYTNQSIGLSFEFVNHAAKTFFPSALNTIVIFDENGRVSDVEQHHSEKGNSNPLGINSPDGCSRSRSDVNGKVVVQVLAKGNFTAAQWLAYLAFVNGIEERELKTFHSNGLEVIAPNKRSNIIKTPFALREFSSYIFAIKDIDKVILFQVAYLSKVPSVSNFYLSKEKVDVEKILNSIIYNKIHFQFQFHDTGKFKSLDLWSLGPTIDQQTRKQQYDKFLKYEWVMKDQVAKYGINVLDANQQIIYPKLDSLISQHQIKKTSAIPKFKIITPGQDAIRKYETIDWDSVQVSFSHRVDDTNFIPMTSNRPEDYFYDNKAKIASRSQASGLKPNAENLKKYKHYKRIFPLTLQLHPAYGQNIGITRMANGIGDEQLLKAMVEYENSNQYSETPSIKIIETKGWKIYISTQLVNQGRSMTNSNVVLIDSGRFLYRVSISGGFKSDILHLLNSLKIEGKQFYFQYNNARQLENIEII